MCFQFSTYRSFFAVCPSNASGNAAEEGVRAFVSAGPLRWLVSRRSRLLQSDQGLMMLIENSRNL
jgi:hypothetical protein